MQHHSSSDSSTDVNDVGCHELKWTHTDQSISSDQTIILLKKLQITQSYSDHLIISSLIISLFHHDSKIVNCIIRCNVWLLSHQFHKSNSSKFWFWLISIRLWNISRCPDIFLQRHWSRQSESSHTEQICQLSSLSILISRHRELWSVNLHSNRFRAFHRESSQSIERINLKNSARLLLLSWILSWSRQQKKDVCKFYENDQSRCWIQLQLNQKSNKVNRV
jgi:hypothetical protein